MERSGEKGVGEKLYGGCRGSTKGRCKEEGGKAESEGKEEGVWETALDGA